MARDLDAMAVIFPFEVKCYADTPLPVEFVGHPFVAPDYVSPVRHDPAGPVLLLPGSRRQAVARIAPVLFAGFALSVNASGGALPDDDILAVLRAANPPPKVSLLRISDAGMACRPSGFLRRARRSRRPSFPLPRCSLERHDVDALRARGHSRAIAYRAHPLTYLIGRWLVKVPYLGIANLLLNEPMYPEFIQGAATPRRLRRSCGRPRMIGQVRSHRGAGGAVAVFAPCPIERTRRTGSWGKLPKERSWRPRRFRDDVIIECRLWALPPYATDDAVARWLS